MVKAERSHAHLTSLHEKWHVYLTALQFQETLCVGHDSAITSPESASSSMMQSNARPHQVGFGLTACKVHQMCSLSYMAMTPCLQLEEGSAVDFRKVVRTAGSAITHGPCITGVGAKFCQVILQPDQTHPSLTQPGDVYFCGAAQPRYGTSRGSTCSRPDSSRAITCSSPDSSFPCLPICIHS